MSISPQLPSDSPQSAPVSPVLAKFPLRRQPIVVGWILGLSILASLLWNLSTAVPRAPTGSRPKSAGASIPPPPKSLPPKANTRRKEAYAFVDGQFKSFDGNFKVRFPALPTKDDSTGGRMVAHTFLAFSDDETMTYAVTYTDYPLNMPGLDRPDAFLKDRGKASDLEMLGKLEGDKKIWLGKHPGREVRITDPADDNTPMMVCRSYLVKERLYLLQIVSLSSPLTPDKVDAFFDSFALLSE